MPLIHYFFHSYFYIITARKQYAKFHQLKNNQHIYDKGNLNEHVSSILEASEMHHDNGSKELLKD